MNAIIKSVLALSLSTVALQASASLLITSNNFENGRGKNWTYASNASTIVSAPGDAANKVLRIDSKSPAAVTHNFAKQDDDILVSFNFLYTGKMSVNTFLGVYFDTSANSPNFGIKADCDDKSGKCKNDVYVRMGESNTVMMLGSDLAANTNYTIFGRLYKDKNSATYNRFDAWLDPTADEMASLTGWNASATGSTNIKEINKLRVRSDFIDTNSRLYIDNLQVSEVPEPTTLSLIGLAMAGVAFSRRKRS